MKKAVAAVGALSAFLFLLFSWPLLLRFSSSVFADPQWPFDTYGTLYGVWWMKYAWAHGLASGKDILLAHPFGLDWSNLPVQPLVAWPLFFFSLAGGEIFSYNLFVVLNFALTGAAAYALCYYCTGHPRGSLLGALLFTFSSNHLIQTMAHVGFSALQWIPLFILCWLYLWEKRTWKGAVLCALSFCLLFWSNYYFFYFSLFFIACFLAVSLFNRKIFPWKGMGKLLLGAAFLAGALLSPQALPLAKKVLAPQTAPEIQASGYVRSEKDLQKYGARLSDYVVPSELHPIFGRIVRWAQKKGILAERHWSDRTLFLGTFSLGMVPVLFFARRRFSQRDRFLIRLSVIGILFFIWFSLVPWLRAGPLSIPTPSAILHPLFPMFRYYSRAGFFASLFLSVLVAYVWKYHPVQFGTARKKNIVVALFACLAMFEFLVVPPARNLDLSPVPAVYTWLKEQPGDFAVVEYPFVRAIEERQQKYAFYQRVHRKPLVNGGDEGTLSDALRKQSQHVQDSAMWSLLAHLGTKYAIVHENAENFQNNPSLKFIQEFDGTKVYEIAAPPQPLYTLLWNFGQAEKRPDGEYWRSIGRTAKIWCLNAAQKPAEASLALELFSPEENSLNVILNGKDVFQVHIKGGEGASAKIQIPGLKLQPGENLFQLIPERVFPHPSNATVRISFCLREPELQIQANR